MLTCMTAPGHRSWRVAQDHPTHPVWHSQALAAHQSWMGVALRCETMNPRRSIYGAVANTDPIDWPIKPEDSTHITTARNVSWGERPQRAARTAALQFRRGRGRSSRPSGNPPSARAASSATSPRKVKSPSWVRLQQPGPVPARNRLRLVDHPSDPANAAGRAQDAEPM